MQEPVMPAALASLLERFRRGDATALARAISQVEDQRRGFQELLHEVVKLGPRAERLGVTGPPGAGKSTLVSAIVGAYRREGERIGIVAVDPSSPFSGGALLGDRVRMNDLATDPGVFIRSMATRGSLGGLATTTKEVVDLMDGFRFDRVVVETVGVGQTELEVTAAADTIVVVLVPESGDSIQAMKAGLMEIADIFVVNKADRPGADRLVKEIRLALHLRAGRALEDIPAHHGTPLGGGRRARGLPAQADEPAEWQVPVVAASALSGEGIGEILAHVRAHRAWLDSSGALDLRRRARAQARVREVVDRELRALAWHSDRVTELLAEGLEGIERGVETPYSVAGSIMRALVR